MNTIQKFLKQVPKVSAIYFITFKGTKKKYVGSSIDIHRRFRHHLQDLVACRHYNTHLQAAFNKYKIVGIGILEYVKPVDLIKREQHWIDVLKSANRDKGYNLTPTAGSSYGYRYNDASKRLMSLRKRDRKLSASHVQAMSFATKGVKKSPSHNLAVSNAKLKLSKDDILNTFCWAIEGVKIANIAKSLGTGTTTVRNILALRKSAYARMLETIPTLSDMVVIYNGNRTSQEARV